MPLALETNALSDYLQADSVVDINDNSIRQAAAQITFGLTADTDKARALFEWVRDTIPHTRDGGREEVTCAASHVLSVGTGICYAKSHLLAALLRTCGIPAGFCYQVYQEELHASADKIALHGLNGIYLPSLERWVRADCRGNTNGINAQFSTGVELLAFPTLNFLDNRIYARPLPQVLHALQTWATRSQLWPHLPGPQ